MERQPFRLSPILSLSLAAALWGFGTVISKGLLGSVSPILFLVIQLAPSVVMLWAAVLATGARPPPWRIVLPILLLGLLNPGLSYTLSMLGLAHTSASVATLMWSAEPALIVALAWVVLREKITVAMVALTMAAALGVFLASGGADPAAALSGGGYGAALILAGVVCCALYTVFSRDIASATDPLFVVAMQQTAGLAWALAIWPLEWKSGPGDQLAALSSPEWLGGLVSGLMYYALAFWFYLRGLATMPASRAGNFLNLIPVFGIAAAHVFLGERLVMLQWFGAASILLAVFLLQMRAAADVPAVKQGSV